MNSGRSARLREREAAKMSEAPVRLRGASFVEPAEQTTASVFAAILQSEGWSRGLGHVWRFFRWFVLLVAVVGLWWWVSVWWARSSSTNPVLSRLVVDAPFYWRSELEVKALLKPVLGLSFWCVDVEHIRQGLQQRLSLRKVTVAKIWPDILRVTIEEMVPLARWGAQAILTDAGTVVPLVFMHRSNEAEDALVPLSESAQISESVQKNNQQQVLKIDKARWQKLVQLPVLVASYEQSVVLKERYYLLRQLGWPIAQLELTARGAWKVLLASGLVIELGSQHFNERVRKVATIMQAFSQRLAVMEKIDARYPNGVSIRWRFEPRIGHDVQPKRSS